MEKLIGQVIILMLLVAVPFQAITVSPLCPTNKIAPRRRLGSSERPSFRTLGAYYDLLTPSFPQANYQDPLQEQPQQDDPDDCGEIEDYDENDLNTLTQLNQQRQERDDSRLFFGGPFHRPPQQLPPYQRPTRPPATTSRPQTRPPRPPQLNYPPQRPPYWSGGPFTDSHYHAPTYQNPSDNFKPVHEAGDYSDVPPYRPSVVGGPLGHIVGISQARPSTTPAPDHNMRRRPEYNNNMQSAHASFNPTRRPRTRNFNNNNSIIGSFIDLLFK